MKASLQAKMGQQMALTPQLLQSIRLLQVTSLQLEQELQQVLERNPLLEQEPEEDADSATTAADSAAQEAANWDELPEPMFLSGGSYIGDVDEDATARIVSGQSSDPRQRLLQQLEVHCDARELAMAAYWLDCCDDQGYLEGSPHMLAAQGVAQLCSTLPGLSEPELLIARQRLLNGEWPGMAAIDPRECLLAQLRALPINAARTVAMGIVDTHLDLLAKHDLAKLAWCLDATAEEVAAAVRLILSLQAHPVEQPPEPEPAYIVPDVIAWYANGNWQVRLNTRNLPRLRLCAYAEQAANGHDSLRGLLEEARWMLRSLGIRNETLLNTARVLVTRQQGFLERGEEAIAPLTLKEVADTLGVHESTISRITTGKYIQTPRGTLELKRLFAVRLEGAEVSGAAIKAMVRRLIEDEPAHAPLADDAIAALLAHKGIRVARRTVAKYREQLAIAPARERKRAELPTRLARLG